jgi:flavin reductase (DIM6/NTAB) family NADH-FMN oxidoreductase RutF
VEASVDDPSEVAPTQDAYCVEVTIHDENPFADPPAARDALRQFRGRLPAPVTVLASGTGRDRVGLTVSSLLVVLGEPGHVVAMVDPDSGVGTALQPGSVFAVSVLGPDDAYLAEAFAGLAPAPGGLFRLGRWVQTDFGPALEGATWLGATVTDVRPLGWTYEVVARVDRVELERPDVLLHQRGRYLTVDDRGRLH